MIKLCDSMDSSKILGYVNTTGVVLKNVIGFTKINLMDTFMKY